MNEIVDTLKQIKSLEFREKQEEEVLINTRNRIAANKDVLKNHVAKVGACKFVLDGNLWSVVGGVLMSEHIQDFTERDEPTRTW